MADVQLTIKTVMENSDVLSNINQIQSSLSKLKMPKDLTSKTQASFDELKRTVRDYQNILDKPNKSAGDLRQLDQLGNKIRTEFGKIEKEFRRFDFKGLDLDKINSSELDTIRNKIEKITNAGKEMAQKAFKTSGLTDGTGKAIGELQKLESIANKMTARKGKGLFENFIGAIKIGDLAAVEEHLEKIKQYMKQQSTSAKPFKGFEEAKPVIIAISNALENMTPPLSKLSAESKESERAIEQLVNELRQAANIRIDEMATDARKIADGLDEAAHAASTYHNSMSKAAHQQTEMQYQVQNLQQQIKNYFGLDEIFRRIGDLARNAMDTVKELDAAMTETAVVTNFDVSDMWKMLPTYTKNANQLGSTIADVYNAATLYYQQGLTTTQSMSLANETLKMARIGGIEAAEATDMMTAALRGFNMEINQTSAQRVNDVYSKLAAITAADTKEIGTAMERTASIANSANMDFETTSAFLSQMIETTREAPENLGTAMKTIVARFQEMKVDPSTLIDSEGERLDFNRVDKALKAVGISLINDKNEFRDLDDVFLDIASRWDGMSQAQQRYVATMAAGSRQQSRFIAMMQDYDRTMELVDAAYTAEGAGQAQFEKTLESMDSKLNRLKNAWDQFAMGFMNADFLKVGVDTGTKFLDIFEKIITGISQIGIIDPFKGIIKSALTATAVFGGLLGMSKLLMAGVGKWASFVLKEDAADMGGIIGAAANQYGGVNNRRQQLKEEAKIAAKQSREMNRQVLRESMSQDEGGFFSSLKTGGKVREEYRNFQKQMQKEMANGKMSFANFDKAFSNLSQPLRSSLAPQITNAFRQAVNSADIDGAAKEAALNFIEAQEALFDSGQLNINGLYENLKGNPNIDLDDINVDDLVHEIAPMSKIDEQFNKIGNGAAKAGQSIQMFGANLMGTPLQPFGTALMVVGQGIENIGMLMGSGLTAIKKWGASMVATGTSTLAAGQSAGTASLFFRGLGVSIKEALAPLLPFIAIAAVAAAAIAGIYLAATAGERALKKQGDAAAQASQDLDTTKQALEAVNNDLEELANNDASLDKLITGTTEWNNQLAQANAHIIEMMGNYKTLNETDSEGNYKYVKTDEDGRMSITESGQEAIRKEYQNAVNLATANNAIQGALYNNLKDLNSKQYKDNQTLITASNMARQQGGAITSVDEAEIKRARLENENIQKQNTARLENAWKTGMHAALSDLGMSNTDALENILTNQRDALVKSTEIAHGIGSRKENEKQYAELMGYEWTDKGKYKDAQGNELSIEYDTVKEMLPELQALSDAQGKAAEVQSSLTSAQSEYNNALKKKGREELAEVEGQDTLISDVLSKNADANLDAVNSFLNADKGEISGIDAFAERFSQFNDENAKVIADLLGEEVAINNSDYQKQLESLKTLYKTNSENMLKQQADSIKGAAGVLDQIDWGKNKAGEAGSDEAIKSVIDKMTTAQINSLNQTAEAMGDNVSNTMAESYARTVADLASSGDSKAVDDFQNIFKDVDFTSGISTLEGFNKVLDSNNKKVQEFGKQWEDSGAKAEITSKAMREVFSADDFTEVEEELREYSNEMGAVDASKILEMAKSSQTLKRYLDETGASAEGFARSWQLIADGKISVEDLTSSVVAAVNAMEQLSASAGRADQALESFEIKNDTGKYGDAIQSQKEAIDEMIANGEYGNEGLEQVLKQTFGAEKWAEAYSAGEDGIKKLYNEYTSVAEASADDIASLYKENDSVDDMLQRIQDHYKVNAEMADVLLQKATNANIELKQALENNNVSDMWKAYSTTNGIIGENGKPQQGYMGSMGEIKTQALAYAGDDVNKQQEFLKTYAEGLGLEVDKISTTLDFANGDLDTWVKNLATASDHIAAFDSSMNGEKVNKAIQDEWEAQKNKGSWWEQSKSGEGTYDVKQMMSFLEKSGANQQQALEATQQIAKEQIEKGKSFEVDGQKFTEEDVASVEAFTARLNEITESQQWVQVGQTLGQQIVAALTGANFLEQVRNGEAGQAFDKNGFQENNFNGVVDAIKASVSGQEKQQTEVQNYLKQSQDQFKAMNPEQQKVALDGVVSKLNELDFSPQQIASTIKEGLGVDLSYGNKTSNLTGEEGKVKLNINTQDLQTQLDGTKITPEIDTSKIETNLQKLTGTAEVTGTFTGFSSKASGQNNHRFGTFARGSRNKGYTIPGRPTLTGEEGEELVWEPKRNEAFMVGTNGPQFANISRDAVVWNADQTERIKKNSGVAGIFGLGAKGIRNFGTMGKGGSRGSGATGGGGTKIPGVFQADVTGNIKDVIPPADPPTIPVKGKLQVEGSEKGGLLNKIKSLFGGGKKGGPSINVTANVTKVSQSEGLKTSPVKMTGQVTSVTNNVKKRITGVKATATVTKVTKGKQVSGEPIKVKAKATATISTSGLKNQEVSAKVKTTGESQVKSLARAVNSLDGKAVKVKAKVSGTSEVRNLASAIYSVQDKKVTIKATKTVSNGAGATGLGKYTPSGWNSLAKGSGKVGPRGRGGLTLTGEEGFEVAWLPSQNKSLILGTSGPQMVDLPKDVVVWPHKQSKKIMEQKSVPVRSMASGTTYSKVTSEGKGKNTAKNIKAIKHLIQTAGKINYWWWNYTQKVEATQRRIDKLFKTLEKTFSRVGKTFDSVRGDVNKYTSLLKQQTSLNTTMRNQANKNLSVGAGGSSKGVYNNVKKAQKSVNKAQVAYNEARNKAESLDAQYYKLSSKQQKKAAGKNLKKRLDAARKQEKKALKALTTAEKNRDKKKVGANWANISYEVTTQKREKGKVTKSKETKKEKIDLAPFISYDPKTQAYQVDYGKINKTIGVKSGAKAKAVGEAAKKFIEDNVKRRNDAEDKIESAREALEKLSDDVYETFYRWEKSITKVYLLSTKLEELNKQLDITQSRSELQIAKQEAGISGSGLSYGLNRITTALNKERGVMFDRVKNNKALLDASKAEYTSSLDFSTYLSRYLKAPNSPNAKDDYTSARMAFDLLKKANLTGSNFNYSEALKALRSQKYSSATEEGIKKVLDDIFEKQTNYLDSINEAYGSITEIYNKIEELQSFIAEFEDGLLEGLEEQAEDELKKLEDLNSSLSKAFKDLIDEIKNKLDERRKKEDNEKTESDITKKQQRLAMLRANTSGGHQVEIAQLQKEIAEAQQSYQRTLEDQLLDRLQKQGDEAEKQRERQINLLTTQNELAKITGSNLEEVKNWLKDPTKNKEQIRQAWLKNQGYDDATPNGRLQLEQKFESEWIQYLANIDQLPAYQKQVLAQQKGQQDSLSKIENNINNIADAVIKISGDRTAKTMRSKGYTAAQLKTAGYQASSLKAGGYAIGSIAKAGYKESELRAAGITPTAIKNYNKNTKSNKVTSANMRSAGFSVKETRQAGFTDKQIKQGGYTASQFKASGSTAKQAIGAGYSVGSIVKAGYKEKALRQAKITPAAIKKYNKGTKSNKITVANMKNAGFDAKEAKQAGFTNAQVAKAYGSTVAMTTLNMSGKATQAATGASAKALQKIVNKSKKDKATQKDMANVQAGTVDVNGKKNKGGVIKDSHLSSTGTTIGANSGSTLYTADWDEKTGKVKGAWTKYTIDKLTTTLLKKYPVDAKQALVYAITHTKVGSTINKNFASLTQAAGLTGKYYKLNNGIYGSISSKGWVFYNSGKKGVYKWNPAAGKLAFEKYNEKNFIKQAKNKNIGREYAQVLKANKVKGYKTGGLADQTGPAWLDGTPTKPELVLNAQDTKNFLALKDVLSHATGLTNSAPASYGDTNVEVNINVDNIGNDYDVDRLVQRVKKDITKEMSYRNVTQVRNFR